MKYTPIFIIVMLWLITILASLFILRDTDYFTKLSPVYFICMLGSIVTVRSLIQKINGKNKEDNG
jgi:hypothetical protein